MGISHVIRYELSEPVWRLIKRKKLSIRIREVCHFIQISKNSSHLSGKVNRSIREYVLCLYFTVFSLKRKPVFDICDRV